MNVLFVFDEHNFVATHSLLRNAGIEYKHYALFIIKLL